MNTMYRAGKIPAQGIREAIAHLIEIHGRRRIAFIKGLSNYQPHTETIYV